MKKLGLLCLVTLLLLSITGCGNNTNQRGKNDNTGKMICSKTETDEDGYTTDNTITATYKNDKLLTIKQEQLQKMDAEYIDFVYGIGSLIMKSFENIGGMMVTYEKVGDNSIKTVFEVNYEKLDYNALEEISKKLNASEDSSDESSQLITNIKKDLTLDEFKEMYNSTNGYTCK